MTPAGGAPAPHPAAAATPLGVRLDRVTKRFGEAAAVRALSLDVPEGAFFTLLGPSGCGKTTALRVVAGFEAPDEGRVEVGGRDVTHAEPHRRGVGLVFQSYALFPHLSVFENVAYGLRVRGLPARDLRRVVAEHMDLVRLPDLGDRRVGALSGGQQQRVALARALAPSPDVLLLDEPLSNLDARLRDEMREEIVRIHREAGRTTLYVTHDQAEALEMSDLVAVMEGGVCRQVAPPREVYHAPADAFVARFVGASNLLDAAPRDGGCLLGGALRVARADLPPGPVLVRPEAVLLSRAPTGRPGEAPARVLSARFAGPTTAHEVAALGLRLRALTLSPADPAARLAEGDAAHLAVDPAGVSPL